MGQYVHGTTCRIFQLKSTAAVTPRPSGSRKKPASFTASYALQVLTRRSCHFAIHSSTCCYGHSSRGVHLCKRCAWFVATNTPLPSSSRTRPHNLRHKKIIPLILATCYWFSQKPTQLICISDPSAFAVKCGTPHTCSVHSSFLCISASTLARQATLAPPTPDQHT